MPPPSPGPEATPSKQFVLEKQIGRGAFGVAHIAKSKASCGAGRSAPSTHYSVLLRLLWRGVGGVEDQLQQEAAQYRAYLAVF